LYEKALGGNPWAFLFQISEIKSKSQIEIGEVSNNYLDIVSQLTIMMLISLVL